ncbi:hypothetical protein CCAX7_26030 [Capsulimonas corticalis]|uniref:Uncharacterized protein n=1 Tax=Capsulimonas corticalis TaxID=2219043 RepID=A0A402CVY5_9BACT|nr:hypothetical protein CCAX7_26030 [Capsulimonas corticalis]
MTAVAHCDFGSVDRLYAVLLANFVKLDCGGERVVIGDCQSRHAKQRRLTDKFFYCGCAIEE